MLTMLARMSRLVKNPMMAARKADECQSCNMFPDAETQYMQRKMIAQGFQVAGSTVCTSMGWAI